MLNKLVAVIVLAAVCLAQDYDEYQPSIRQSPSSASRYTQEQPKQEPIAILKQINRHNEDGSYTYGYEGADGSFKIETKDANGDVKGKYGYVDGDGKVRTVEYGADKYGFQPSGEGITVAPINYNDVKDYEEEQQQQQQYVPRPKQAPKAPRPQSFNYAPAPAAPVVENRKPVYAAASPAPPQYYYEDEQEQPTQRPIQITRPKYSIPTQPPQQPRPQPPPQPQQLQVQQPQYMREFDFSFDPQPARQTVKSMAPFYQQFENRQPVQFPAEGEASVPSTRAQEYSLFSPADARADTYKPKFTQFAQQPYQFAPQPQAPQQQPQHLQRPVFASKPAQSRSTSVLDQLAKDPNYILPQGSPALHDISFGYSL